LRVLALLLIDSQRRRVVSTPSSLANSSLKRTDFQRNGGRFGVQCLKLLMGGRIAAMRAEADRQEGGFCVVPPLLCGVEFGLQFRQHGAGV
jgi:hypothetical protein